MASTVDRSGMGALARAREILRQGALTRNQFKQLDWLFDHLSMAEFDLLTSDPIHRLQLKRYESFLSRRTVAIMIALIAGFFISAVIGIWLSLQNF